MFRILTLRVSHKNLIFNGGCWKLFLPLFIFLPRLIRYAMKVDTDAVLDAFGKNEQIRKVFWAQVVDPATANQIAGMITGIFP
jgi:hypothetical protein